MKIALPIWTGRISPVFDVAQRLLVVEVENGVEVDRHEETLGATGVLQRAKRVAAMGADVLICGAISMPLEAMLASSGVRVISQTCGPVEEVLGAFLTGRLNAGAYRMPGCCGRGRRGMGQWPRRGRRGPARFNG